MSELARRMKSDPTFFGQTMASLAKKNVWMHDLIAKNPESFYALAEGGSLDSPEKEEKKEEEGLNQADQANVAKVSLHTHTRSS